MDEYEIYVGLSDSMTREQLFPDERYMRVLKNICRVYHIPFSVAALHGGYFSADGDFVYENTLMLRFLEADRKTVMAIAEDLGNFFRQESVMITHRRADVEFLAPEKFGFDSPEGGADAPEAAPRE